MLLLNNQIQKVNQLLVQKVNQLLLNNLKPNQLHPHLVQTQAQVAQVAHLVAIVTASTNSAFKLGYQEVEALIARLNLSHVNSNH